MNKKKNRILVTGLASLQWGRLEYGNNGNYYLIAPIFSELHRVFPAYEIVTTFQMSDDFVRAHHVTVLPLEQYFSWRENDGDLKEAMLETAAAETFARDGELPVTTPFLETLERTALLVSFNGDMWGDNRDSTNANRFFVELLKLQTAQRMGIPTVLFASSPGPIDDPVMRKFCKQVYESLSVVINREAISKTLFESYGYDVSNTVTRACPAFLFGKEYYPEQVEPHRVLLAENIPTDRKLTGFIVTTNSLPGGSFSDWERPDSDFDALACLVEHAVNACGETVVLFSHSDGFVLKPEFRRVPWRDYKMGAQLYAYLQNRGIADMSRVFRIQGIYQPWEIHSFIGELDLLISGKLHGAVAGMEQFVPTLPIDFQNGPIAHKMQGMFSMIGMADYIVPRGERDFIPYYEKLRGDSGKVRARLKENIPAVQERARDAFEMLTHYVNG